MRRAVLFLVVTFAIYAAAQSGGGTSVGTGGGGAPTAGTAGGSSPAMNVPPGLNGQPAVGPAAEAPTTNLGPSSAQPLGPGQLTGGSTGAVTTTGGFVTNGGYGAGYVPLLQTPEATFPPGITNIPNNPAGISNMPLGLQYENKASALAPTSNNGGVFNTGAATFGLTTAMPQNKSLGEVAREYRSKQATQHARVYTNADIQRLDQQGNAPVVSVVGPSANMPPTSNPQAGPAAPTTPAVNNRPPQPGQNRNLPGGEAPPHQ